MGDYWPEIKRAIIIASGIVIWIFYALLIAAVRMELLNALSLFLVFLWIFAVVCALRVVLYLSIPREERDIYEFKRPHLLLVKYWNILYPDLMRDRIHDIITFFVHPYTEMGLFVYMIVHSLILPVRLR